jgi:hypothetical protein
MMPAPSTRACARPGFPLRPLLALALDVTVRACTCVSPALSLTATTLAFCVGGLCAAADPSRSKGIHCRFGMHGVVAEGEHHAAETQTLGHDACA